jgi:hypothetical protein
MERNCENIAYCSDIFNCLNKLSNHYRGVRTLLRRLYEIRNINIWIIELDKILDNHNYAKLRNFLSSNKIKVIIITLNSD